MFYVQKTSYSVSSFTPPTKRWMPVSAWLHPTVEKLSPDFIPWICVHDFTIIEYYLIISKNYNKYKKKASNIPLILFSLHVMYIRIWGMWIQIFVIIYYFKICICMCSRHLLDNNLLLLNKLIKENLSNLKQSITIIEIVCHYEAL